MAPEPSSISEVARSLRSGIYAGKYPVGARVPTREKLAQEHGVSAESAGVAMRMLRDEGLISLEQGRGTFVLRRYLYDVEITLPYTGTPAQWEEAGRSLAAAVAQAAQAEPSVRDVLPPGGYQAHVALKVETANWMQAVKQAHGLLVRALALHPGPWDILRARVEASAAPEEA